ncbi:MAG: ABC transporter substrate-binding protein [Deltaproteobacteria bacterium]|nr:ABC transporter substrate-binding protein [Deltaproteobacteria bacterium]
MMSRMKRIAASLLIAVPIAAAMATASSSADAPAKLTPLRIGIASRSPNPMPYFVALERGFFREEGLEPEIILMKAIQVIQSLVGGSIDFGASTGTAVSAAVNGADVRVVLALNDKPDFDLIARPNITTVQELRGKKIGVSAAGSLGEILARRILSAHHVPPDQVTILSLGQSHFTYASLKAGVLDAIMATMPLTFIAQDEGFRKLAAGGDVYRTVNGGLATTKMLISKQPDVVTKVIRASLRAVQLLKNDRKYGIEFFKGPHLDIGRERHRLAERVYEAAVQGYLPSGSVDEKLQREMIADAARRIKPGQPISPERVFDFSFAHKASEALR